MSESARFPEDLIQAVDYGLAVPVELVRAAICERIERNCPLARDGTPDKLETFDRALHDLLGAGGKVMEKLIVRNLYPRLGLSFKNYEDWTLVDYVNHAKEAKRNG